MLFYLFIMYALGQKYQTSNVIKKCESSTKFQHSQWERWDFTAWLDLEVRVEKVKHLQSGVFSNLKLAT